MKLTAKMIEAAKPPAKRGGTGAKLSDGHGLHVLIDPSGSKAWRLKYFVGGRERLMSLGSYPRVSLAEAREKRDEIRKGLRRGVDPQAVKRAARVASLTTFKAVADKYLALRAVSTAPKTREKAVWLLTLLRSLWNKPMGAIETPDVLAVLQRIEANGRRETAHRCSMLIGQVYRYAAQIGAYNGANPAAAVKGALQPVVLEHHAAITDRAKVGGLLRAIDGYSEPIVRDALKFALLTAVRPGELRGAQWDEIKGAMWHIPAGRMKAKIAHTVPLSRQALAVLTSVRELAWLDTFVFPGVLGSDRGMSNNTMTAALRRLGYSAGEQTVHGFRSIFSTLMNEAGEESQLIELSLAHQESNKVRAAYNRATRLEDRQGLMQRWADMLDTLRAAP